MSFFRQFMKRFRQHSPVRHESRSRERRIAFEPLEERRLLAAVPTTFRAEDNGGTSVEIRWDLMPGATGYEVQRSISGIDQWEGFGSTLGALDKRLEDDFYRSYYFRIRSVEESPPDEPIYSPWTDPADADCTANPVLECSRPTNSPEDNTVKVSAIAHSQIDVPLIAATIELRWPEELAYQDADYKIYRKTKDELSFTLKATLTWDGQTMIAGWTDENLGNKTAYEYKVERTRNFSPTHPFFKTGKTAIGYVYAGVDVPLDDPDSTIESPGTVVLVIDETQKVALETELDRLRDDLIAEGWGVETIDDVNPSHTIESVRDKIVAKYEAPNADVTAVFLIGAIPIPMSGLSSPDNHTPARPMPADVFYGDMDNDVNDNSIWKLDAGLLDENTVPTDVVPDGKPVELMVGRVDMRDLANFQQYNPGLTEAELETELLRRYLDKDHAFRTGQVAVERKARIRDRFAFTDSSTGAWQTLSGFFGPAENPTQDDPDIINIWKWEDTDWARRVTLAPGRRCGRPRWTALSLAL